MFVPATEPAETTSLPSPASTIAPAAKPLRERVEEIVTQLLPSGTLTLELVGSELRIRPRTLQRKLQEQGTSLSMIVDDVRRAIAVRLLTEGSTKAWAIATELGFRDKTAFYRAFRRWTGSTPRRVHPLGGAVPPAPQTIAPPPASETTETVAAPESADEIRVAVA